MFYSRHISIFSSNWCSKTKEREIHIYLKFLHKYFSFETKRERRRIRLQMHPREGDNSIETRKGWEALERVCIGLKFNFRTIAWQGETGLKALKYDWKHLARELIAEQGSEFVDFTSADVCVCACVRKREREQFVSSKREIKTAPRDGLNAHRWESERKCSFFFLHLGVVFQEFQFGGKRRTIGSEEATAKSAMILLYARVKEIEMG